MTQYARPNRDIYRDAWSGGPPLYAFIDEEVRDDSDFILSPANPQTPDNDVEIGLSSVYTPANRLNHILRYTYGKNWTAGKKIDVTVQLKCEETVIAQWTHVDVPKYFVQADQLLTEEQASQITNYSDLRVRFKPTTYGTGPDRELMWSWAVFEVPDPAIPPIVETIIAEDFPMNYLPSPIKAQQLTSKVSEATIQLVSQDYPLTMIKSGKAEELKSKWM
jgi:hypothetical protein